MGGHERATVFVIYVQNIPTRAVGDAEEEMKLNNCFTKIDFYRTRVRSLAMLVTHSLTHSLRDV